MASTVLKTRHSLVGKNLLPMILELKGDEEHPLSYCRLKKDHPLDNYNAEELTAEFKKLTGETAKDVLLLAGKDCNFENLLLLMHKTILYCNAVGTPKSSVLTSPADHQTPGPSSASGSITPVTPTSGLSTTTSAPATACTGGDFEQRMKHMEETLLDFKTKQSEDKVEEALKNVRTLASRPKLTSASVLLAALEVLVQNATKAGNKETDYYVKALQACRQYEDHPDICNLCLKLLGSNEDKKISNTIADWVKSRKYEIKQEKKEENDKVVSVNPLPPQPTCGSFLPYPPYPIQYGNPSGMHFGNPSGFPAFGFGPAMSPFPPMRRPNFRAGRQRPPRNVCYFCKSSEHFINDCPKLKKEK